MVMGLAALLRGQEATLLVPGIVIERQLAAGEVHPHRLTLARGDFVRLTIEQQGVDVAASLLRPDGTPLVTVDAMDDEFRPETMVGIADVDGTYLAMIRPAAARANGRYSLLLDQPKPAAAGDDVRVEAERVFARGRARCDVNNAATWPDALADFKTARGHYRSLEDRPGEMKSLIEIGVVENYLSRPEALEPAEAAERLARALDDRPALARILRVKASIYRLAGDLRIAAQAVEQATEINRALGNRPAEMRSLNFTANMYMNLGEFEVSIALFEEALPIARAINDSSFESTILGNLGQLYARLGEFGRALPLYGRALSIARETNNPRTLAGTLNALSAVQVSSGNHVKARELLTESLGLVRKMGDGVLEAAALNLLGATHFATGAYSEALDRYAASLTILRPLADLTETARALEGTGRTLHRLGQNERALESLQEALSIRRRLRHVFQESNLLRNLAEVEHEQGRFAEALGHARAAVELDETVRARITSPELRASYVANEQDKYELLIDILQQRDAVEPARGYAAMAFEASERARARVLLESLLDARVDLRRGIAPALLERERSLQKRLNDASTQLSRAFARTNTGEQSNAAQTFERLSGDYQQLQVQIRQQSPHYAAVMQPRPLDAAAIQNTILDPETVLLEFALGEERSWLWAMSSKSLTSVELPPRREIEAAARSLYEQLTARQKRHAESRLAYDRRVTAADARLEKDAAAVSRMLLGGIASQLNAEWRTKRLVIVPAGGLQYLPFAALPSPGARASLAASHEIGYIPSASVLAVLRREAAGRTPAPRTLAILADPVFETADPRVTLKSLRTVAQDHDATASRAQTVVDGLYSRIPLSRLPFSRDEAYAIASLSKTNDSKDTLVAVDFKASREAVLGGLLSGYRVVHLATHGVIDTERPALSSLIFSLVDERGRRQNGYLRLPDIYNMRLDADLVVLSACQTALGKEIKGEGLVGLTRAFVYAGAPRVLASLWQVSDLATAELMKKFYRGMLRERRSPAAALRAAQVEMSQDPRWRSPFFWAGFVLQGEWR
jgi:CHAT domain-containing protein/predicted negative regulator of RcsB-dependent stress response